MQDYTVGRQWMHLWHSVREDIWWAIAVEAEKQIYGCEQGNNVIATRGICFLSVLSKHIVKVKDCGFFYTKLCVYVDMRHQRQTSWTHHFNELIGQC